MTRIRQKHSEETKKKISNSLIGHLVSDETKKRMSKSLKGRVGKASAHWRGGRRIDKDGYVCLCMPEHPNANYGYVKEHRIVMEKHIGRYLTNKEIVHHENEIKDDNRIENLKLFKNASCHVIYHHKSNDKQRKGHRCK